MFHSTMKDALENGEDITEPVPFNSEDSEEINDTSTAALMEFSGDLDLKDISETHFSPWVLEEAAEMAGDHDIWGVRAAFVTVNESRNERDRLLFLVDEDDPSRAIVCAPRIHPEER